MTNINILIILIIIIICLYYFYYVNNKNFKKYNINYFKKELFITNISLFNNFNNKILLKYYKNYNKNGDII